MNYLLAAAATLLMSTLIRTVLANYTPALINCQNTPTLDLLTLTLTIMSILSPLNPYPILTVYTLSTWTLTPNTFPTFHNPTPTLCTAHQYIRRTIFTNQTITRLNQSTLLILLILWLGHYPQSLFEWSLLAVCLILALMHSLPTPLHLLYKRANEIISQTAAICLPALTTYQYW